MENVLVHIYFCVEANDRSVVAVFSEYGNAADDFRYIKKAYFEASGNQTFWSDVDDDPEELTSESFEVYSLPVDDSISFGDFGFLKALELFCEGNLTEDFLSVAGHIVPHRG